MPFIENAFKYGVSNHDPSALIIRLEIADDKIIFFTENRIFGAMRKAERIGVGIENTEKRLNHLYPGRHRLTISRGSGLFSVNLSIDISNQ
jgi:sensor histidine kinase YesM